jgi:hypothetical protein
MKKVIENVLIMSLGIAIVGMLLKFFHFEGANLLLMAGLGTVSLVGLAKIITEPELVDRLLGVIMTVLALGFLYKMMHYRGASIMLGLALGAGLITVLLLYRQAKK